MIHSFYLIYIFAVIYLNKSFVDLASDLRCVNLCVISASRFAQSKQSPSSETDSLPNSLSPLSFTVDNIYIALSSTNDILGMTVIAIC